MSDPRRWIAPTSEQIRVAALLAARLGGCNCKPEIRVRDLGGGVRFAEVRHDAWCAHPQEGQVA